MQVKNTKTKAQTYIQAKTNKKQAEKAMQPLLKARLQGKDRKAHIKTHFYETND